MNKCILCRRCIRACSEMQCAQVLTKADRGFNQRISTAFGNILGQSGCELDGQCVALCRWMPCPKKLPRGRGRNWEMTKTRSVCPLCGCGCVFDLHTKERELIKITSNFSSPANQGALLPRSFSLHLPERPERADTPLLKKGAPGRGAREALEILAASGNPVADTWSNLGPAAFRRPPPTRNLFLGRNCPRSESTPHCRSTRLASCPTLFTEVLVVKSGQARVTNPTTICEQLRIHPGGITISWRTTPSWGSGPPVHSKGAAFWFSMRNPGHSPHPAELLLSTAPGDQGALIRGLLASLHQGRAG